MNIRPATEHEGEQWNTFVFSQPTASFMQSWQWGEVQKLMGAPCWRYVIEDGSKNMVGVVGLFRRDLPLGRSWLYAPRGPVLADSVLQDKQVWGLIEKEFEKVAKDQRSIFVRIDPQLSQYPEFLTRGRSSWKESERQVQPQHTLVLDLHPSEEELLGNMHSKTRYNIRLAGKKGVTTRFSTSLTDIDIFLELGKEVSGRTNFHYHPDNYYRAMLAALAPSGMFEVAIAEHDEQPLAAHLMVYAGGVATYVHGASSHAKRSLMAPQLLYWETIKRAKEKGCTQFDFFGVAPEGAGANHPWAGITRVKEGFSGKRVSFAGAMDKVVSEGMYDAFNMARRVGRFWR